MIVADFIDFPEIKTLQFKEIFGWQPMSALALIARVPNNNLSFAFHSGGGTLLSQFQRRRSTVKKEDDS